MKYNVTQIDFDIDSVLTQFRAPQWLGRYWEVLSEENSRVNLVSRETTGDTFRRIVAEALLPFTQLPKDWGAYLDIGSGGGIPALPVLLSESTSGPAVLYERIKKKATALSRLTTALGLSGAIIIPESFGEHQSSIRFSLVTLSWVTLTPALLKSIVAVMQPGATLIYYSQPNFESRDLTVRVFSYSQTNDDIHKYFSIITK